MFSLSHTLIQLLTIDTMMTKEQWRAEADEIAQFVYDKRKVALREVVEKTLHRQPTLIEWNIAITSFFMGGCCVADAISILTRLNLGLKFSYQFFLFHPHPVSHFILNPIRSAM